jgi:hypothetical protein
LEETTKRRLFALPLPTAFNEIAAHLNPTPNRSYYQTVWHETKKAALKPPFSENMNFQ